MQVLLVYQGTAKAASRTYCSAAQAVDIGHKHAEPHQHNCPDCCGADFADAAWCCYHSRRHSTSSRLVVEPAEAITAWESVDIATLQTTRLRATTCVGPHESAVKAGKHAMGSRQGQGLHNLLEWKLCRCTRESCVCHACLHTLMLKPYPGLLMVNSLAGEWLQPFPPAFAACCG